MQPVIQEEKSGCGFASVATLAGVAYTDVKNVANSLGIYAEDRLLWSSTDYVRTLLKEFGVKCSKVETPFSSWDALPNKALLSIKWRKEKDKCFWHWVVSYRNSSGLVVLDPKKALKYNIRKDFGKMHPKWYIKVF